MTICCPLYIVSGFVHRIFRACSSWKLVHESLERAKVILENNQYPPRFYEQIISDTLTKIVEGKTKKEREEQKDPYLIFLQYRGKCSETYARDLRKTEVPCRLIFTMRKLKTVTPSLKPLSKKLLGVESYTKSSVHAARRAMLGRLPGMF